MATYMQGKVQLVKAPESTKELLELRKKLRLEVSIGQMKEMVKNLPCTVIEKMTDKQFIQLLMTTGLQGYLLFLPERKVDTGFGAWCAYKGAAEQRKKQGDQPAAAEVPPPQIIDPRSIQHIARMLTDGNPDVMWELRYADSNSAPKFFHTHKQQFAERGIDTMSDLAVQSNGAIWLLGLVDILIKSGYACELDWKTELEDFLWSLLNLHAVKNMDLPLDSTSFNEDDDVETWVKIVNDIWRPVGFALLTVDIDSDSYVLVPCSLLLVEEVKKEAAESSFNIF